MAESQEVSWEVGLRDTALEIRTPWIPFPEQSCGTWRKEWLGPQEVAMAESDTVVCSGVLCGGPHLVDVKPPHEHEWVLAAKNVVVWAKSRGFWVCQCGEAKVVEYAVSADERRKV